LITPERTGRLCAPGSASPLADAMADLIGQPDQRRRLGTEARASIIERGMTGQAMAANHEKIYRQLLH
jgi:hypothetical protein